MAEGELVIITSLDNFLHQQMSVLRNRHCNLIVVNDDHKQTHFEISQKLFTTVINNDNVFKNTMTSDKM